MPYLFPAAAMLIFSKAPEPGLAKTRLQPALTPEQAAAAQARLTRMTLKRALEQPLCPVTLYCAPDASHAFFRQCSRDYKLTLAAQSGGDLGERMRNAFVEAFRRHRHVILTGSDCPSLTVGDLRQALRFLQDGGDAVIGPAADGGYVLIGLNADRPELFGGMPWGSAEVLSETRRRAAKLELRYLELAEQWDVDFAEDWLRYLLEE